MTCADHYIDGPICPQPRPWEQLVALSDEACPHRGGDLHLDVLLKYGKVLSWDGDAEGAVDAFTAADEVLAERPAEEPGVQRRRAEVWMELAQALRAGGDLDGAERQLSGAVETAWRGSWPACRSPRSPRRGSWTPRRARTYWTRRAWWARFGKPRRRLPRCACRRAISRGPSSCT
ncbi:unnamed protein product [Prorocentrum cordatum]|uniref:KIF-binding protein n=1 Tax=Prorocentrum cordatum TaxID=2364126 RepID=A0ABN9WMB4_9DINO|nr:unnamed protein product [Polarella glacialis]